MLLVHRENANFIPPNQKACLFDVQLQQEDLDVLICPLGSFKVGKRVDA
jgi:hypothetical protein